jgi:hypothetical protein
MAGFRVRILLMIPSKSLLAYSLTLLWLNPAEMSAQGCCTAGASFLGGFNNTVQPYRTLSLSFDYQFNSLTTAFQGNEEIDDPLRRTAEVAYFTLKSEYGLQPHLSVLLSVYYADKNRELTVQSGQGAGQFTETAKFRGSGVGDLTVLLKYEAIPLSITSDFGLAFGGGASLPTGSYTEERDGSQLSIDLQPGTGAITLIGWGLAAYGLPEHGLSFFFTAMYRYSDGNPNGYRIGDEVLTNLGVEKSIGELFSAQLALRSRYAFKDFASGRFLIGTGGTYHDAVAALIYTDGPSTARLLGHLPVYRNVRGIQMTTSYLLGVEYQYTFDFRSVVDIVVPEL